MTFEERLLAELHKEMDARGPEPARRGRTPRWALATGLALGTGMAVVAFLVANASRPAAAVRPQSDGSVVVTVRVADQRSFGRIEREMRDQGVRLRLVASCPALDARASAAPSGIPPEGPSAPGIPGVGLASPTPWSASGPPWSASAPPWSAGGPPWSASAPPWSSPSAPPWSASGPPWSANAPPWSASGPPWSASGPPWSASGPPWSTGGPSWPASELSVQPWSASGPPWSASDPPVGGSPANGRPMPSYSGFVQALGGGNGTTAFRVFPAAIPYGQVLWVGLHNGGALWFTLRPVGDETPSRCG